MVVIREDEQTRLMLRETAMTAGGGRAHLTAIYERRLMLRETAMTAGRIDGRGMRQRWTA